MHFGHVRHHLSEQFQSDQEAVQRVFVQFVGTVEQFVQHLPVMFEVANQQRLGEFGLVLEMVEEAALGDTGSRDQFVDRGAGEAFRQHGFLGQRQQALAGVAALWGFGFIKHA